jgi:thymidylate kinase
VATDGIEPDCVFVLDMAPEIAAQRMDRPLDRMERQGDDYRAGLRAGFLAEARAADGRVHVIDAGRSVKQVHEEVWGIALPLLGLRLSL